MPWQVGAPGGPGLQVVPGGGGVQGGEGGQGTAPQALPAVGYFEAEPDLREIGNVDGIQWLPSSTGQDVFAF